MIVWSLHSGSSHSSTAFSKWYFDLFSSLQISWSRNINIYLDVFRKYTCGIRWSLIESAMVFLALTKFFLCKAFILVSLWNWNLSTYVGVQFHFLQETVRSNTSMVGSWQFHQSCHQAGVISHFEMRTSNVNSKILDLINLRCPSLFRRWLIQGLSEKP